MPRFAKHLRRYRDNLFVFLDRADVEATNYPAEQDMFNRVLRLVALDVPP